MPTTDWNMTGSQLIVWYSSLFVACFKCAICLQTKFKDANNIHKQLKQLTVQDCFVFYNIYIWDGGSGTNERKENITNKSTKLFRHFRPIYKQKGKCHDFVN